MKNEKVTSSLYRQIAIDIAVNIANGKYIEGDKLFGRSVLSSHYKVSPETIRKAVFLLKDVGILDTEKGSGIEIISAAKAKDFLKKNENIETLSNVRKEIETWAKEQVSQTASIIEKINYVLSESERSLAISPLNPFQVRITPECKVTGKTVADLQFWHNTGGTIIAIRRGDSLIVSPGPYATLCEDDFIFIIGDEASYTSTLKLLFD